MNSYYDLEINVLSCFLQKPELMQQTTLEDKHFIKNQRVWQFMKAFYAKFQTFDLILMYQVCKDKYKIIEYLTWLLQVEPIVSNFEKYEQMLIRTYEENKKDKWIVEKIYSSANELYVGNINLNDFKNKIKKIEEQAEVLFKKE